MNVDAVWLVEYCEKIPFDPLPSSTRTIYYVIIQPPTSTGWFQLRVVTTELVSFTLRLKKFYGASQAGLIARVDLFDGPLKFNTSNE